MPPMNAWSLLYEELNMSENFEDRYEDGLKSKHWYDYDRNDSDRKNPFGLGDTIISGGDSADTISFSFAEPRAQAAQPVDSFMTFGSESNDTISFDLNLDSTSKNGFWNYREDVILKEVRDYLSGTYRSHYTSQESKTQTLDLVESIGDAEPFCRSNAIKYLSRFGKKDGKSKLDILKAIHYCILLYHFSGVLDKPKGNYETF